jgi:mRNA interferase MazF
MHPGHIVLFRFPQTDLIPGKMRPALLLGKIPNPFDDWLVCMISSETRHKIEGFDEIIRMSDSDFAKTGLKTTSLIRLNRLAVVDSSLFPGKLGEISPEMLYRLKGNLIEWLEKEI